MHDTENFSRVGVFRIEKVQQASYHLVLKKVEARNRAEFSEVREHLEELGERLVLAGCLF